MMKMAKCLFIGFTVLAFYCAGCSKKEEMKPVGMQGVDIIKLQNVYSNATPEMATELKDVAYGIRYGDPMKSMMALDKLANDPQSNDAQKKVVNETIEAVKKLAAQQGQEAAPPAQ